MVISRTERTKCVQKLMTYFNFNLFSVELEKLKSLGLHFNGDTRVLDRVMVAYPLDDFGLFHVLFFSGVRYFPVEVRCEILRQYLRLL